MRFWNILYCVVFLFVGCGSNIPIDPVCEDVWVYQEEERNELGCPQTSQVCEVCLARDRYELQLRNERQYGYTAGYRMGRSSHVCVEVDRYNDGWEDGFEVGKYSCERGDSPWTCADFDDGRPEGHKPVECRHSGSVEGH